MRVLLSIKPEFANKIFSGEKRFEFRRTIFKCPAVKTVVVYASSPIQKVIGEFEVDSIIKQDIETLWRNTSEFSGISRDFFMSYFSEKEHGFAIKIKSTKKYRVPRCIRQHYNALPPQSFIYLD